MSEILDLERYPLDQPGSTGFAALVMDCLAALDRDGLFNLDGLIRPAALATILKGVVPVLDKAAFTHRRRHNIYFKPAVEGLAPDHAALQECETVNHTICADQIATSPLITLYEWPPFADFLAAVMGKPALHPMADKLARVNVMAYYDQETLGWHFDRSEFTTTLLLQAPVAGGDFEYAQDLRSPEDPNYDAVAKLVQGQISATRMPLSPGTLNVFRGRNTAHRVTPVEGAKARIISVFSYFDRPGVEFSPEERMGFYGRAG